MSTLQSQFPGATGLRFKPEGSLAMRAVRFEEGVMRVPENDWGEGRTYFAVVPPPPSAETAKRKSPPDGESADGDGLPDSKRVAGAPGDPGGEVGADPADPASAEARGGDKCFRCGGEA